MCLDESRRGLDGATPKRANDAYLRGQGGGEDLGGGGDGGGDGGGGDELPELPALKVVGREMPEGTEAT